jgi:tRNA-splicing ligase RtcB
MLHSGSRNLGTKVADHYDKVAKNINKYWLSVVPVKHDLAFLPIDSDEGKLYMKEMQYCVDFALANRQLMMTRIINIFKCTPTAILPSEWNEAEKNMINIAHNYAAMENHFGENVMVHRKGATKATEGLMGIIPGSQGSSSYIVKGKGNRDSFKSCSHGAGRAMGRNDAKRKLNLEEEQKRLDDMGVIHSVASMEDLDEAVGAYKDIDTVMANQSDLVDIEISLRPLGVVKEKKEKRKKRW